jgi:ATP-dependent DNA helicase RecG
MQAEEPVSPPTDRTARILDFCQTPRHREEIQKLVGMNNRDHFRKEVLNKLIAQGLLRPTLPDKPNSPKQQYVRAD